MTTRPITERRRAQRPALLVGVSVAALAAGAAWIVGFGVAPIPGWNGSAAENLRASIDVAWRATREWAAPTTPDWWLPPNKDAVIAILVKDGTLVQFGGRVLVALLAGLAAAWPIAGWRYKKTARRLGTKWIGVDFPRWSEGSDAVVNANFAMADSIARTGRGLEIAPGVALSREWEARAILAIGDPGSGKTVAFWHLIFQLRNRAAHLILHDVKGDITARWPDDRFILLAPHDARSWGWAIGRDIRGEFLARELAAQLIAHSERAPNWPNGAQEILVGVIVTLQNERKTAWGWAELKAALDLPDPELREFATRYNPAASRFLALAEDGHFTLNAGSYVSTLMAPINKLVAPLAKAWGDLDPEHQMSLTAWLDQPRPEKPALILQRAADLGAMLTTWIGAAVRTITTHLLATRKDANPADAKPAPSEVWFLLDEFPQIGLDPSEFLPLLETGRSLSLRAVIGVQNFDQLARSEASTFPDQLRQLAGSLLAFNLNPGRDAQKICDSRLTTAPVRTWKENDKTKEKSPSSEQLPILLQDDLSALRITRNGAQGYLIHGNAAFGLTWGFADNPKQREGTVRASWVYDS